MDLTLALYLATIIVATLLQEGENRASVWHRRYIHLELLKGLPKFVTYRICLLRLFSYIYPSMRIALDESSCQIWWYLKIFLAHGWIDKSYDRVLRIEVWISVLQIKFRRCYYRVDMTKIVKPIFTLTSMIQWKAKTHPNWNLWYSKPESPGETTA